MKEIKYRVPFFSIEDDSFQGFGCWGYFDPDAFTSPPSRPGYKRGESEMFTGVRDVNDRDIYEGDICRIYWNEHYTSVNGKIIFLDGCFKLAVWLGSGTIGYPSLCRKGIEVIGNIHVSRELLEPPKPKTLDQ